MGKHVVITGSSSGIGEQLALELAKRGYDIGLLARREAELKRVAERIAEAGGKAAWRSADVTDLEALTTAVQELEAELGPCDVLVANAGVIDKYSARKHDAGRAAWMMRINYEGAVNAVDTVVRGMIERGRGQLVVISSVAGYRGIPKMAAYSATKAAVSTYWEGLRVELAPKSVVCTAIHPGYVKTAMTAENTNPMPFLVDVSYAAPRIVDAIERGAKVYAVPWQMSWLMNLTRCLPNWLYDPIMRAMRI